MSQALKAGYAAFVVDKSRVAAIGFSNGGRVSCQIAREPAREMYSPSGLRFAAAVAVYGKCLLESRGLIYLDQDVDQPLLTLLGELDEDRDARKDTRVSCPASWQLEEVTNETMGHVVLPPDWLRSHVERRRAAR